MGLKENVLKELEKNRGKSLSGAYIAKSLSVSRTAVWKAVEELRKSGFDISAVTNKGYMLTPKDNSLSAEGIYALLGESKYDIHVKKTVASTNTELKELAKQGKNEGYVLAAQEQTEGKGRLGRKFYSPDKTGLYLSIILRPKITIENSLFITTAAAVAVARAIEALNNGKEKAEIKWVNDIFIGGKKVCGILTEASVDFESGFLEYAVLGIGINILPPTENFPDELKDSASSVFDNSDQPENILNKAAAEILRQLSLLPENFMDNDILEEYKSRSFLIGKTVYAMSADKKAPVECVVLGIDDKARLIVQFKDGSKRALSTGEVNVKLK